MGPVEPGAFRTEKEAVMPTRPERKTALLVNGSNAKTSIAIWVRMQAAPDDAPIAWLSALLSPDSYSVFQWQASYEYIWANTGKLFSGKIVNAAQRVAVSDKAPAVRLEQHGNGYRLVPFTPALSLPPGRLLVEASGEVPMDQLTVGVNLRIDCGMGQPGDGASVVQAQPNLSFQWTVGEAYFANFGIIPQSQYDPPAVQNQAALPLDFGTGSEVGVILDRNNTLKQMTKSRLTDIHREPPS